MKLAVVLDQDAMHGDAGVLKQPTQRWPALTAAAGKEAADEGDAVDAGVGVGV
jgi:hypothetical protein